MRGNGYGCMKKKLTKAERDEFAAAIEKSIKEVETKRPLRKSRRLYFPRNDEELLRILKQAAADVRAGRIDEV